MRFLGEIQINKDDHNIIEKLATRKDQALFIYLACTQKVEQREYLAEMLWPDRPSKQAMANLRTTLTRIRRHLKGYLTITRKTLAFDHTSAYRLDVQSFQSAVSNLKPASQHAATLSQAEYQRLRQALKLYHGAFLSGFHCGDALLFEEWAAIKREQLHQMAITGLHALILYELNQGNHAEGLVWSNQLLSIDPFDEQGQQSLMRLLWAKGQRIAALEVYEKYRTLLHAEMNLEPTPELMKLFEEIRRDEGQIQAIPPPAKPSTAHIDWGNAPENPFFYGREAEQITLKRWITAEKCCLVTILGMGGMGKTSLARKVVEAVAPDFEYVIWRSVLNAPPLTELIQNWLQVLSNQSNYLLPDTLSAQIALLLTHLKQKRCLLVLDNLETLMHPGQQGGQYQPGYENYGQLLTHLNQAEHQSCLLLTSRERPLGWARKEKTQPLIRSLQLPGLNAQAGQTMLQEHGLISSKAESALLIEQYSGNPLALKLIFETITDLFGGRVASFLEHGGTLFEDIEDVLKQQFAKLSPAEYEIIIWLAVEREPITVKTLTQNIIHIHPSQGLLTALRSLQRRSLIEKHRHPEQGPVFTLQNVIMEHATATLTEQICTEIAALPLKRSPAEEVKLAENYLKSALNQYALIKAQGKDYVRQSQERLILGVVAGWLKANLPESGLKQRFQNLLTVWQKHARHAPGYLGGNLLNLLLHLQMDVRGYNFSKLNMWQVNLRGFTAHGLNLAGATLKDAIFTDAMPFIYGVDFSPNGQLVAAATYAGEVRLWRVADKQAQVIHQPYPLLMYDVAFSPDGAWVAGTVSNQGIHLWPATATDSAQARVLLYETAAVSSLAFSPDSQMLAGGSFEGVIYLWPLEAGASPRLLQSHSNYILDVAFSPDGRYLASASLDGTVRVWAMNNEQTHHILASKNGPMRAVAFHPNAQMLASAGNDGQIYMWAIKSGRLQQRWLAHQSEIHSLSFSPTGQILASAGLDQVVKLWSPQTGQPLNVLRGHTNLISGLAFSPDGQTLMSGGFDQKIYFWEVASGKSIDSLQGHTTEVHDVAFSPDGRWLLSGSQDGQTRLWDVDSGQIIRQGAFHARSVQALAFSPDGKIAASSGKDPQITLWDTHTGEILRVLKGHRHPVCRLVFSPSGDLIISGSEGGTLRAWDVTSGKTRYVLQAHQSAIHAIDFRPQVDCFVSAGIEEGDVSIWQAKTGRLQHQFFGLGGRGVQSLACHADNITLAVAGRGDIHLWHLETGMRLGRLSGHTDTLFSLDFSPDGKLLTAGGKHNTVYIWDVAAKTMRHTLTGHTSAIENLAFHPSGKLVASASPDETIRLWDVAEGRCKKVLRVPGPYTGLNISNIKGLTNAQRTTLRTLGAIV